MANMFAFGRILGWGIFPFRLPFLDYNTFHSLFKEKSETIGMLRSRDLDKICMTRFLLLWMKCLGTFISFVI